MTAPEALARQQIDTQLATCGWAVQDYRQFDPAAARGIALREVPLKSGPCDYLLLVDRKPIGVIEAKKTGTTLSTAAQQTADYAVNLPDFLATDSGNLPFLYESTGVETLFRDARDPEPKSRRVFAFHRPETLVEWASSADTLRARLRKLPLLPLPATRGEGWGEGQARMRACQIEAIANLEQSFAADRPRALIQMATGTGKTFTAVSFIVEIAREVFGKGNDFCQKITYRSFDAETRQYKKPKDMIAAFRNSPQMRIAVTVDMIATGTDIRPLECLIFMRDVKSRVYFEQMKGRGTRVLSPTELQAVSGADAKVKDRFVIVDAVGVCESDKTDSRPLEKKPGVSFRDLMLQVAFGKRDEDALSSLASRLARLDRDIDPAQRKRVAEASGGASLADMAHALLTALDPDRIGDGFYRDRSSRFLTSSKVVELRCTILKPGEIQALAAKEPNSITDGPFGSKLKTDHYTSSGPRVIRLQNIGDGFFVDEKAHISEDHFASLSKHRVFPGDLVIAGLGETLPRACLIPDDIGPAIVKADCIRFKAGSAVLPKFLMYALNADKTRRATKERMHGVGRPRLNLGEIKSIVVPVPPLERQRQIVAEADRRVSVVEELETQVHADLARAGRLRQAVLASAFSPAANARQ